MIYLQHLDESNGEVQVCQVATDQTQTEEDADGDDGPDVDTASHLDGLTAVQHVGPPGEDLGHERSEHEMVGGEDDGVALATVSAIWLEVSVCRRPRLTEVEGIEDPFVEENDRGGQADPDAGEQEQS